MARVHNLQAFSERVGNLMDSIEITLKHHSKGSYIYEIHDKKTGKLVYKYKNENESTSTKCKIGSNNEVSSHVIGWYEQESEDVSMASSKVERANERGDINKQYRTYVKDAEKIDGFSEYDEMDRLNIFNIEDLIFDFDFIKRYNIDLKSAKDIIQLDDNKFITQHGIDAIKRLEKREGVCLGIV